MAIYLKYEGIDGDATHEQHKKWIQCNSLQWGAGRAINTPTGRGANREASEVSVSEVTFTKECDTASVKLFQEVLTSGKGKKVEIHLVTTGDPGDIYMTYELEDTLVSSYSLSSGGDKPSESISLNFAKFEYKFIMRDSKGNPTPSQALYDLRTTKKG